MAIYLCIFSGCGTMQRVIITKTTWPTKPGSLRKSMSSVTLMNVLWVMKFLLYLLGTGIIWPCVVIPLASSSWLICTCDNQYSNKYWRGTLFRSLEFFLCAALSHMGLSHTYPTYCGFLGLPSLSVQPRRMMRFCLVSHPQYCDLESFSRQKAETIIGTMSLFLIY